MKFASIAPRPKLVCAACRPGLTHRLVTLHAGGETLILCHALWEGLPGYLRETFTEGKDKRRGVELSKRQAVAREIHEHLQAGFND